jgi:hypothetical protein
MAQLMVHYASHIAQTKIYMEQNLKSLKCAFEWDQCYLCSSIFTWDMWLWKPFQSFVFSQNFGFCFYFFVGEPWPWRPWNWCPHGGFWGWAFRKKNNRRGSPVWEFRTSPSFLAPRTLLPNSQVRPWGVPDYSQERPGGSQERPTLYFTFLSPSVTCTFRLLWV